MGVVAMPSKNAEFSTDDVIKLTAKRVRIFPHDDLAGLEAASRWAIQLRDAAASIDAWLIPRLKLSPGSKAMTYATWRIWIRIPGKSTAAN